MYVVKQQLEGPQASPVFKAPRGVAPNFENPPNHNKIAIPIISICLVLSTFGLLFRAYCKKWREREKGPTNSKYKRVLVEVFFFFAWLASIGCFTVSCVFAQFPGFYVNIRDLRLDDLGKSLQLWLIFQYLFLITVAFIKISIWLEWCETLALNIFKKWTRIGSLGVMVLTGIILLISIALLIKVLVDGDCYDQDGTWGNWKRSFSVAVGVLGISQLFIDLGMLLIPLCVTPGLNMNLWPRLGLVLFYGSIIIPSTFEFYIVINLVSDSKDADIIWNIGNLQLFTHIAMTSWLLLSAGTCKPKTLKDIFRRRGRQNGVSSTKAQSSNFPNKNPQVGSGSSPDSCDNPSVSPIELEAGSQSVPRNAESQENLCEG